MVTTERELPFNRSVGYQIRLTHRLVQRYLQQKLGMSGVTPGMWYFLRALWDEDGLTQRELSDIVGTMEPTTLSAIKAMETLGLVRRMRNAKDRRKINIHLTQHGRQLEAELIPLAREVLDNSVEGFSEAELAAFMDALTRIQRNLLSRIDTAAGISDPELRA